MYPGSQFKKTKAVFRDGVFLLLPRPWQHRDLFSSSVRNSSRLTTADTQHPSINGPFRHAHYIRHTKTPRITVCKFNLHAHSTCYILLLAWSKEGQKPAGVRFTPVVTNTCENLRIQYIFTVINGHMSLLFPHKQLSSCKVCQCLQKEGQSSSKKERKSKKKKERKKNFLSSNVQIPVRNEPLPLTSCSYSCKILCRISFWTGKWSPVLLRGHGWNDVECSFSSQFVH